MFITATHSHPSARQLVKATLGASVVAAIILVTTVLPAEYGIDPTGIGTRLGLDVLGATAEAAEPPAPQPPASTPSTPDTTTANTALSAKANTAFGVNAGQSFDTAAVSLRTAPYRNDTLSLTLEPGKGAEVKAMLKAGDGIVFHWTATGDVALDMHGERPDAKGAWTSYAVERSQREASGTFIAPFDGSHGWYWQNRGTQPVTINIQVAGYQEKLYRP
ncbi:MAG TPA: hypothetical protein VGE64_06070 [Xanthomonadaceae bacterium]